VLQRGAAAQNDDDGEEGRHRAVVRADPVGDVLHVYSNADAHPHGGSDADADADTNPDGRSNTDSNSYRDTDAAAKSDSHAHPAAGLLASSVALITARTAPSSYLTPPPMPPASRPLALSEVDRW
jgi:hypothetical protein